ncbi:MAG: hypothetical protein ACI8RD_006716 [Bacillariaceae sp.]|jgi:hypothetical protein
MIHPKIIALPDIDGKDTSYSIVSILAVDRRLLIYGRICGPHVDPSVRIIIGLVFSLLIFTSFKYLDLHLPVKCSVYCR